MQGGACAFVRTRLGERQRAEASAEAGTGAGAKNARAGNRVGWREGPAEGIGGVGRGKAWNRGTGLS
eukprot:4584786-Pleurochrysis_carterae.AAC.4